MNIKPDVEKAYDAIAAKQPVQNSLFAYYDGKQPTIYAGKYISGLLEGKSKSFTQNWCAMVIDSELDKLNLRGFSAEKAATTKAMQAIWDTNEIDLESDSVHEAALITGESFAIVWADDGKNVEVYYNDPRMCHMQYNPEKPREKLWAAKRWVGIDGHMYITIYYPDRLEHWRSSKTADKETSGSSFDAIGEPVKNPYGEVPVFHFRSRRRNAQSDLDNVTSLQDAVNVLLTDMMATAEYNAFPQRYIISSGDLDELKNAPAEVWDLAQGVGGEGETKVGQFAAANLNIYTDAIDKLASSIGVITRTPKHYFFGEGGSNLSGEALIAMEAPLNAKVTDRIDVLTPVWRKLMAFALTVGGAKKVDPLTIMPEFDEPATIQPRTAAEITAIRVTAGMPLTSALRLEGMDNAQIEQIDADMASFGTVEEDDSE